MGCMMKLYVSEQKINKPYIDSNFSTVGGFEIFDQELIHKLYDLKLQFSLGNAPKYRSHITSKYVTTKYTINKIRRMLTFKMFRKVFLQTCFISYHPTIITLKQYMLYVVYFEINIYGLTINYARFSVKYGTQILPIRNSYIIFTYHGLQHYVMGSNG